MIDFIGWTGAISFIVAYAFLSIGWLKPHTHLYHFLNALGGLCLVINALHFIDVPNLIVNLIWMGIAIFSMVKIYLDGKADRTATKSNEL